MATRWGTLSSRGSALAAGDVRIPFGSILNDIYDPDKNPNGIALLGSAGGFMMNSEVASFINEQVTLEAVDLSYGSGPWGSQRLRIAIANHMTKWFRAISPLDEKDIVLSSGMTSIFESLSMALTDPGEAVMFTRPAYSALPGDFGNTAGAKSVFVNFDGVDQFGPDAVERYEKAIQKATSEGIAVKAVMLVNPMNPIGRCYPKATLIELMKLCQKYKLHLLADEIYAMSVYAVDGAGADEPGFTSVLSFDSSDYIDSDLLHVLYGLSKDFAAGGLRIGWVYTRNKQLNSALSGVNFFHWCAPVVDKMACRMLEDQQWMENFIAENRSRLSHMSSLVRKQLDEQGICYETRSNAGLFLYIDLRPFLRPGIDGWAAEKELTGRLVANKVMLNDGTSMFAEEPGFYRLVFSLEEQTLRLGLQRLFKVLKG